MSLTHFLYTATTEHIVVTTHITNKISQMGHQSSMVFYLGRPLLHPVKMWYNQMDDPVPPLRKGRATSPTFLPDFPPKKMASFFYMRRLWAAVWIVGVRNTGCDSFIICILLLCFQSDNVINYFVLTFCGNILFYNSITWDWVQSLKCIKTQWILYSGLQWHQHNIAHLQIYLYTYMYGWQN